jgi:lipid-binding SYLF domain-containing protein
MRLWSLVLAIVLAVVPVAQASPALTDGDKARERLGSIERVLQETLAVPENIPHNLLDQARCVIVMPSVVKAAFIVGASYGRGAMTCRTGNDFTGPWGPPAMYALEGASLGIQVGAQTTDFVFLVMNPRGVQSLLGSKVRLGADLSAAAGPVGRTATADTDVALRAQILSYSRSQGIFAGLSVAGSTLRPDNNANRGLYGRRASAAEIIQGLELSVPVSARNLLLLLQETSPVLKAT